uniref:Aminotransferase class I/classII large domain-containing protein n=1 Tax=Salix viminalis TaxID=40686 RepID=A0A6N2NF95_SALVM
MENGAVNGYEMETPKNITIKGILSLLMESIDDDKNHRSVISLGMGDPTAHSCFQTTHVAQEAVGDALQSDKFNGYAPTVGLPQTRSRKSLKVHIRPPCSTLRVCNESYGLFVSSFYSVGRLLNTYLVDLPYKLSSDDVFITSGCTQAIDVALTMLARPGANILLPRPGFPIYELCAAFRSLEVRHFDLLPEKGFEADLDAIAALADQNTVALVIINPGNPCGNVYSYQHLKKVHGQIAETAEKLKILVIADEVYGHLAFGRNPFVPMGSFGSIVPVLTLGSLSKRWMVPGWRLGWFVTSDPSGMFRNPKVDSLNSDMCVYWYSISVVLLLYASCIDMSFSNRLSNVLRSTLTFWEDLLPSSRIKEIPCISCPHKPEGSMAVMMKLNLLLLEDISDDIDFCFKLAREESVIILPGTAVGLKNWLRITFAADPASLEEALRRVKSFCQRHSKQSERC